MYNENENKIALHRCSLEMFRNYEFFGLYEIFLMLSLFLDLEKLRNKDFVDVCIIYRKSFAFWDFQWIRSDSW